MDKEGRSFPSFDSFMKNKPLLYGTFVVIGALFIYFSVLAFGGSENKFEPLYKNLSGSDSIEIQSYLSQNSIEFKTEENGADISVKGDSVLIKGELAKKGLPSNTEATGLQRFDEMSIGSTKFDKEVQYQSRLQEDLEIGITTAFDDVESANVKLPKIEEKSIFSDKEEDMTVSVALKPKNGVDISGNNVKAVQTFVASSIQEITPQNVEVVDSQMNVLSGDSEDNISNKSSKIKDETERVITEDLKKSLTDVYGRVSVISRVDINFDEIVQNIEQYDPEGTLVSSEEMQERERKTDGETGREAGANANGEVPGYEIENLDEEDSTYLRDKEHLIDNFQIGKTVEKVIRHPELRNTNVAVWVDGDLTEAEVENLTEMIAISSGLTGESELVQNDKSVYENGSVKVVQTEFAGNDINGEEEESEEVVSDVNIPIYIFVIIGALFLGLSVLLIVLYRSKKGEAEEDVFVDSPGVDEVKKEGSKEEEGAELISTKEDKGEVTVEEDDFEDEKFTFEWTDERKRLKDITNEAIEKNPDVTANVIRELLRGDKED